MTNYTITNFSLEFVTFEQVYREEFLKWVFFLVLSLTSFLTIPLIYGIVWYERNRHYRTLINQLAASICIYIITWLVFVHMFAISHMIFGRGVCSAPWSCSS